MFVAAKIWADIGNGNVDKLLLKSMLAYSAPLILNSISWGITHLTDKIMLTSYCSNSATGLYSAASKVPSILSLITGVFCQAWTLSAIRDYQEEKDTVFYKNIFFITHIGVLVASLFVFAVNNNILLWIIGKDFSESVKYIPVLIMATVFLTYANFYTPIYSAAKKSRQLMYSSFVGMIINVCFNALLIPKNGIMGACIATAVSYAVIALFRAINSTRYVLFDIQPLKWSLSLAAAVIVCFFAVCRFHETIAALIAFVIIVIVYNKDLVRTVRVMTNRR